MPRELSKCREWEKDRRDRLKNEFTALSKLLPCYEPSLSLSKIDILQKASAYIDDLRAQIKELLSTKSTNKTECEEINKLHERIKKLLTRNEQLGNLLKDAGIKLPTECGTIKKFKDTRPWSQKITPEQAKILAKRETQKDKEPKRKLLKKTTIKGKRTRSTVLPPRQRKVIRKSDVKVKKKVTSKSVHAALHSNTQTNLITLGSSQSCFIITNAPSNGLNQMVATNNATVVTNSRVFSSPLVASAVKPAPSIILAKTNSTINTLTSGTLVVANGNLLPMLPQSTLLPTPTLITHPTPVVVNATPPTNNATLIVLPKSTIKEVVSSVNTPVANSTASTTSNVTKTLPILKPKIDLTRTTQVNKVPIPALTSRYANSFLLLSNSADLTNKKKLKVPQKKCSEKSNNNKENKLRVKKDNVQSVTKEESPPLKSNDLETGSNGIDTDTTSKIPQVENQAVVEPELKKPKLDGSIKIVKNQDVSKKVTATSTYSIDSLCNESALDCGSKAPQDVAKEPQVVESTVAVEINTLKDKDNDVLEPIVTRKEVEETNKESDSKPISNEKTVEAKSIDLPEALGHSELSNDIFATLSHVTTGGQNPESTSPTAAFLLAFPLVSSLNSLKVTEVIEDETSDSQHGTPTLLQIGTMDTTKTAQSQSDNLTPNLLNLDNFSFFSSKDICNNFYPPFDIVTSTVTAVSTTTTTTNVTKTMVCESEKKEYTELSSTSDKPKNVRAMTSQAMLHTKCTSSYNVNATKSFTTTSPKNKAVVSHLQKTKHPVPSTNDYAVPSIYNQTFYTHGETTTTTTAPSTNIDQIQMKPKQNENRAPCTYYNTSATYSLPQYNTFNPFTDVQSGSSYTNARSYNDGLYSNNTNNYYNYHSDNFVTNASKSHKSDKFYGLNYDASYDYNRPNESQKYDSRNQQFNNYYNQNQMQVRDKTISNAQAVKTNPLNNSVRPPVNWMTAPDLKQQIQPDLIVPPFAKEMDFTTNAIYPTNSFVSGTQTTYFNTNASLYSSADLHNNFSESRKIDGAFPPMNTFQKNDVDENQFSWSPSKLPQLLDPSHNFVSSTLPTLVGDLALGNTQPTMFIDQKIENKAVIRVKDNPRRSKASINYDNQTNFLSVSQLVDHNKPDGIPSRISNRRSSGNRSSKNIPTKANKRVQKSDKETVPNYNTLKIAQHEKSNVKHQSNDFNNQNIENNPSWVTKSRVNKNPPSSYSAEALISHQPQPDSVLMKQRNQQNYTGVNKPLQVPFLADNIISYFPPVEMPQENAFVQQNQNYQGGTFPHNLSAIQSNVYSSSTFVPNAPTITTSYLSSTNFIPDIGNHDYNPMIPETFHVANRISEKHKFSNKQNVERIDNKAMAHTSVNCNINMNSLNVKKAKRKQVNEANLPGFVDFSFLSMPGTINSPILPDDFHTHSNFLPPPTPTQLYSCKNTLYPKQPTDLVPTNLLPIPPVTRTGIQHPEISPSMNVVGNTLTNFNLSTIFPEINKVPGPDIYPDVSKNKDFIQREFLTSSAQVSFPTKSNLSMSYINSTSTT